MPTLFDPIRIGALELPHRILMAPLTRGRADRDHVPTKIMAEYYSQRASAGLIITESTGISREGLGFPYAPGIWTDAQIAGWRAVTDAVHEAGGRILSQLWHMGRSVHPSFLDGGPAISASATIAPGSAYTYAGRQPQEPARALELHEIPRLLDDYRLAASNALKAGFDGVEIHAGNGYLLDQFLRDSTNLRKDAYGGSVENRIRLLIEVTAAVIEVVGATRTGVRMSPNGAILGVNDSNPHTVFPVAAQALSELGIAFLELREPPSAEQIENVRAGALRTGAEVPPVAPAIRAVFKGLLILNSDYTRQRAEATLRNREADAISFGRAFISNPDLPRRMRENFPLSPLDEKKLYTNGREGYSDYPFARVPGTHGLIQKDFAS
jgi:N-ethylmaleimide reductase